MNIIANWLAELPRTPNVDEFGRPWEMHERTGMTPAQVRYFAALAQAGQGQLPAREHQAGQDTAPMVYRNGVADDNHLYFMQAGKLARLALGSVDHVGDLLRVCLETGLEAIWILAGTQVSDKATRAFIEDERAGQSWAVTNAQYTKPGSQTDGQDRASFLSAYKKKEARGARLPGQDHGRTVYLGWAEHSYSYSFDEISNPVTLLAAISYLEDAIGAPARFSAHTTGKNLMRATNQGERASWIAPVDLSPYPQTSTPATDLVWMRPLTDLEISEPGYLVTADKNSMYAASCTSVQLGEGEPVYKAGADIDALKLEIGIYHIRIAGYSIFDGKVLPHPTDGLREGWIWIYSVKLLLDLGYEVEIIEGYTWARAHTTLRPWAERVWTGRASLKSNRERYSNAPARLAAYGSMQTLNRGAMGLLAHYPDFPERPGAFDWYRPDWNALIVDCSRVKIFYLIWKYVKQGYTPFAVLTDCLYFIGASDNHDASLPGMFERVDALGGFKRKFTRSVTARQIATLQARNGYSITEVNIDLLRYDREETDIEELV